jgi:hypothetical protein
MEGNTCDDSVTDIKSVYKEEIEEFKSCCFRCDKELVRYLSAIIVSYVILGFSIFKLITINSTSEDKSIYISLITLILGIFTNPSKLKTGADIANKNNLQ